MLDVRRLRLLRELALRGTIASVAEALSFSASAVSQQLSALEREAGVALLERTGRSVTLTPAAHALVEHAEVVLERLERAEAELASTRAGLTGPVRIGAFPSATRTILPGALRALRSSGLTPMVFEVDPADVGDALRAGELDVALVHDYDFVPFPAEPGVVAEPLHTEDMYLVSTDGIAALDDARDRSWIVASPGTRCHAMTIRACAAAGFTPDVRHRIDEFDTVLAFVAAGEGVALVPEWGALRPPEGVRLSRVPLRRRTRVAFRDGAARHPAVRAAISALRDGLRDALPD
jgi:DNA-binding transcriptional LysR family regulator